MEVTDSVPAAVDRDQLKQEIEQLRQQWQGQVETLHFLHDRHCEISKTLEELGSLIGQMHNDEGRAERLYQKEIISQEKLKEVKAKVRGHEATLHKMVPTMKELCDEIHLFVKEEGRVKELLLQKELLLVELDKFDITGQEPSCTQPIS